jgi:hypothetical protein
MQINLVPVSQRGISYGGEVITQAITRFRKFILAVIIICPEEDFEFEGEKASPANITRAWISNTIVLFREIGTIAQVTGLIHENGTNINISGTGGRYGKELMDCLSQNNIQPWFYPMESVLQHIENLPDNLFNFNIQEGSIFQEVSIYKRLKYWEQFLVDEIVPNLYTESLGAFSFMTRTGTWQDSWKANDVNTEDLDIDQLEAILSNTNFHETFLNEINSLKSLNRLNIVDQNAHKILKRQIYVSVVTCLETYLSDAFINITLSNEIYIKSFFSTFKDFKDQKFTLNEIFTYIGKSEEIARTAMLEIIYHNLPKVSHIYKETLDINFPAINQLQKDISIRHDLVHRNGKNKKGDQVLVSKEIIEEFISRVESFVDEIDKQLKDKNISI